MYYRCFIIPPISLFDHYSRLYHHCYDSKNWEPPSPGYGEPFPLLAGKAFHFAKDDFVNKRNDLLACADELVTLKILTDQDKAAKTVHSNGSHSRNLDRLKNGCLFVARLIEELLKDASLKLSSAISQAYDEVLAPTHPGAVRMAVKAALWFTPKKGSFLTAIEETEETLLSIGPKFVADVKAMCQHVFDLLGGPVALHGVDYSDQ